MRKWLLLLLVVCCPVLVTGYTLEQRIDFHMGTWSMTSTSWLNGSDDAGRIEFIPSKYDKVTSIMFEFDADFDFFGIPDGGGCGLVALFNINNKSIVPGSIKGTGGTPDVDRTINLSYFFENVTSPTNFTIAGRGCGSSTVNIHGARLIIVQDTPTNTSSYILIGASMGSSSTKSPGSPYDEIVYPKRWMFNLSDHSHTITKSFSATFYSSINGKTVYSGIQDLSSSTDLYTFSTTSNLPQYMTTNIGLTDEHELTSTLNTRLAFPPPNPVAIQRNAFIIIDQTGLNDTNFNISVPLQMDNTQRAETSGSAQRDSRYRALYNGSNFYGARKNYYSDYTMKTQTSGGVKNAIALITFGATDISQSLNLQNDSFAKRVTKEFSFSNYKDYYDNVVTGLYNLDATEQSVIWSSRMLVKLRGIDTCIYKNNNWNVLCSDNCTIGNDINMNNKNISLSGAGVFNINSNITNIDRVNKANGCTIIIDDNNKIG